MTFSGITGRTAAALALAAAVPLHAQHLAIHPGGETIVTATRLPQPLAASLRDVTVITAEEIAASGQLTLAEVLQQLAGVEIATTGGPGSPSAVFMRGANAAHTLVLVDGVRLQSATVGTTAFENIPLSQVERIEVVQGPASSVHGADALGGVIQIFTRRGAEGAGVEASASVGSYETVSGRASLRAGSAQTRFNLAAGWLGMEGFNATRPGITFDRFNADRDAHRNASLSAGLTHHAAAGHELAASLFHADGVTRFDNGPGTDDRTEQRLTTATLRGKLDLGPSWSSEARIGASRDDSESLDTAFPGRFRTDQRQASWHAAYAPRQGVSVLAGVESVRQEVRASTPYDVESRTIRSIFAAANAEHGAHALEASLRRDDNSQFGAPGTGSIAYGYRFAQGLTLRAAYGTAFHAPSFNDLYFPGFGNPELRPERSRQAELGLQWVTGAHRIGATAFDNRIRDLIVFVFDPETFLGRPENAERTRIRGLALRYDGRLLGTALQARFTAQEPEAEPSGLRLQRRARRFGSVRAVRDFGPWSAALEVVASGPRFDSNDESPATRMGGYAVTNLRLARRLGGGWNVALRWNNVFDRDYELAQGFRTPGGNVLLTLGWQGAATERR